MLMHYSNSKDIWQNNLHMFIANSKELDTIFCLLVDILSALSFSQSSYRYPMGLRTALCWFYEPVSKEIGTSRYGISKPCDSISWCRSLSSKMQLGLNLIAAACEKGGIGVDGRLPWKLKSEMKFFSDMTTNTKDNTKQNVVLMGRRTWECIPKKFRPLKDRINIVLTSQQLDLGDEAFVCKSIPAALELISEGSLKDKVEKIWVIGGSSVYEAAMESPNFYKLYLTEIKKHFECDTFFPDIPNDFITVTDPDVPQGVQEENGIEFEYKVYQRSNINL